uniref:Adhesion G protein-coupled receptor G5 n=1 Tax=Otus sunia TaxID=257818 RepID=A0A8C8B9P4_9STRI
MSDCSGPRSLPAGRGRFCRQRCLPASWDPLLGTWEQRLSKETHQGPSTGRLNPSVPCPLVQDRKLDGSRRFRHAMNFPAELVEGIQVQGVEQELVCIYIHSPCIFQDAHNSSVLNNYVLGAYLRSGRVVGLSQPVEIQFWHDMVLVSGETSRPLLLLHGTTDPLVGVKVTLHLPSLLQLPKPFLGG